MTDGKCWVKEEVDSLKHKRTYWMEQLFFPITCQKEQGMGFPFDPSWN